MYYKFEEKLETARDAGDTSVDTPISKFFGLHRELDKLITEVRDRVAPQLSDWNDIQSKKAGKTLMSDRAAQGKPAAKRAEQFIEEMNP